MRTNRSDCVPLSPGQLHLWTLGTDYLDDSAIEDFGHHAEIILRAVGAEIANLGTGFDGIQALAPPDYWFESERFHISLKQRQQRTLPHAYFRHWTG